MKSVRKSPVSCIDMRYFSLLAVVIAIVSCSTADTSKWTDGSLPALYPGMDMSTLQSQVGQNPAAWDAAHAFLCREDLDTLSVGTYQIAPDGVYAIVSEYETKPDSRFEAHRSYIDIQYVLSGKEQIYTGVLEGAVSPEGYDCERDIIFFNDLNKSDRHIADSTVMFIFFPSDLHKPSVAIDHPAPVRKVVVKIPMR